MGSHQQTDSRNRFLSDMQSKLILVRYGVMWERVFCSLDAKKPPPRASRRATKSENTQKRYETGRRYLKFRRLRSLAALRTFGWMWREGMSGYTAPARELGAELRRF